MLLRMAFSVAINMPRLCSRRGAGGRDMNSRNGLERVQEESGRAG